MGIIKRIINKFIFNKYQTKSTIEDGFFNKAYSQEGEDILLSRFFEGKKDGFYLDIGAHHPFRFSNTYLFYQKGWSGINIDAMPGSMSLFEKHRPRDINIEKAIAEKQEKLPFYIFNEPALNTFDKTNVQKYLLNSNYKIIEKRELEAVPLGLLLENYLPEDKQIDFISIDVEGYDLQVLKSNNWIKFKPLVVLVESLEMESINEFQKSEIYNFLISRGYLFFAKTVNTCFFKLIN